MGGHVGPWGTKERSDHRRGCGVGQVGGMEARAPAEAPASDGRADASPLCQEGRRGLGADVPVPWAEGRSDDRRATDLSSGCFYFLSKVIRKGPK